MLATFCYRSFLLRRSLRYTIDKPVIRSRQVSYDSDVSAAVCRDIRDSVFVPPSIFSLSSPPPLSVFPFLPPPPPSLVRTYLLLSRGASVHPRRLPVFLRATHTLTNEPKPCTRWLIYTVILLSRSSFLYFSLILRASESIGRNKARLVSIETSFLKYAPRE